MRLSHLACALVFAAVILSMTACGKKSSSPSTSNQDVSFAGNAQITDQSLDGIWGSSCVVDQSGHSGLERFTFLSSHSVTLTIPYYPTSDCSGGSGYVVTAFGSYQLGNSSSTVSGATEAFVNVQGQVGITPTSNSYAQSMNAAALCGITHYQLNVMTMVVPSATCVSGLSSILMGGETLMAISGNQLYFGNTDNSAIDTTQFWARIVNH